MAKDKDKKTTMESAKEAGYVGGASKSINLLDDISNSISSSSKTSELSLKFAEAEKSLSELTYRARTDESDALEKALFAISEKLAMPNQTDQQIQNRLVELSILQERANTINESMENSLKSDKTTSSLRLLTEGLRDQTKTLESATSTFDIEKSIKSLEGLMGYKSDETTSILRETFENATRDLEDAMVRGDQVGIELARQQLEAVQEGAQSEEKRREAVKANEAQTDIFLKMQAFAEKTADGITNLGQGAVKGVGFLAGLAGMFMLFTDPEKFAKIMMDVMNIVSDIFNGIILILQGDFAGGLKKFEGHWLAITGIIAGLAAYLLGPIIGAFSSIFGVLSKVVTALKVVRLFMMGTLIPGIMATFTAIFGAMAPFVLIGLAIAGIVGLLMVAVKELGGFDSYGDMFDWAIAGMKDAFGSLVNMFVSVINGIIGFVDKYGGAIAKFLGFDMPDLSQYKLEEMATDNLAKVNEKQAAEKVERDKKKESEDTGADVQPLTPLVQQPVVEAIPGQALGIQTLPPIEIQGVQTQPALGVPPVNTGDALNNMSRDNDASNKAAVSNVSQVISQTSNAPTSNSTVTNIMQMPTSRASMTLASISAR